MESEHVIKLLNNLNNARKELISKFPILFKIDGRPFFIEGIGFTSDDEITFNIVSRWHGYEFETYMTLDDILFILNNEE